MLMISQPDRYINNPLISANSANLPHPNERDHWMFGAGYVQRTPLAHLLRRRPLSNVTHQLTYITLLSAVFAQACSLQSAKSG